MKNKRPNIGPCGTPQICFKTSDLEKVSGQCDVPYLSYSAKWITQNYREQSGDAMSVSTEGHQHGGRKPLETSGVYFGYIKTFRHSVELANIRIDILFTHWLFKPQKHKMNRRYSHLYVMHSEKS